MQIDKNTIDTIIDDYLANKLSEEQSKEFEAYFFANDAIFQIVQKQKMMIDGLKRTAGEIIQLSLSPQKKEIRPAQTIDSGKMAADSEIKRNARFKTLVVFRDIERQISIRLQHDIIQKCLHIFAFTPPPHQIVEIDFPILKLTANIGNDGYALLPEPVNLAEIEWEKIDCTIHLKQF